VAKVMHWREAGCAISLMSKANSVWMCAFLSSPKLTTDRISRPAWETPRVRRGSWLGVAMLSPRSGERPDSEGQLGGVLGIAEEEDNEVAERT